MASPQSNPPPPAGATAIAGPPPPPPGAEVIGGDSGGLGQVGQFLGTLGSDILSLPGNIAHTLRHPLDTALAQSAAEREAARKSYSSGEYLDALTHGIGGYAPVPFLAPFLSSTLADLGSHENLGRGAARLTEFGVGGLGPKVVRNMEVPTLGPVSRFVGEHVLGIPKLSKAGKLLDLLNGGGSNEPGVPPPAPLGMGSEPGPYFNERSTLDPGMHGPIPPVAPLPTKPFFTGSGTATGPTASTGTASPGPLAPIGNGELIPADQVPPIAPDPSAPTSVPHYNKFSQTGGPFKIMRGKAELGSYDNLADAQKAINNSSFVNGALKVANVPVPSIEGVTQPKVIDISNSPALPPVEGGSPVPPNASTFKHPADFTDLIRQFHATHPKGTSLRTDAQAVFGLPSGTMPTYEQALAIHEWRLRNPGKSPTANDIK